MRGKQNLILAMPHVMCEEEVEGNPREVLWLVLGKRKLMRRYKWDYHSVAGALKP